MPQESPAATSLTIDSQETATEEADANLEEGEIVEDGTPKKKKKRHGPRGGNQWAKRQKGQAAARAVRKAAKAEATSKP